MLGGLWWAPVGFGGLSWVIYWVLLGDAMGLCAYCMKRECTCTTTRRIKKTWTTPEGTPLDYNQRRGNSNARGYNRRWRKARETWLARHPLCVACKARGRTTAANVVDHIKPHRGDSSLFWDTKNWQSLCTKCHNSKTGKGL